MRCWMGSGESLTPSLLVCSPLPRGRGAGERASGANRDTVGKQNLRPSPPTPLPPCGRGEKTGRGAIGHPHSNLNLASFTSAESNPTRTLNSPGSTT